MTVCSLTKEEVNGLSNPDLVKRMDEIIQGRELELYGLHPSPFKKPTVKEFFQTRTIFQLEQGLQRKVLFRCFEFIVHRLCEEAISGASNSILYNRSYDENSSWQSPAFQIRSTAFDQAKIILSRASFEKFMELLHLIEEGADIKAKRSKIKGFSKWLQSKKTFAYFAYVLPKIRQFDDKHRAPEVHKHSRLINRLLEMRRPTHEESNAPLQVANVISSLWTPLIDILNGNKPTYITGSQLDFEFLRAFLEDDESKFKTAVEKIGETLNGSEAEK